MKIKTLLLIINLALFSNIVLAQCEVKKINIKQGVDRYSMTEKFIENNDFENGLSSVYLSVNYYGDKTDKSKPMLISIVVTYAWSGNQKKMVPNTLVMEMPSGVALFFQAQEKSTGTLNTFAKMPSGINSIECTFNIPLEDIKTLLREKSVSKLNVFDSNTFSGFKNFSNYKEQIPEMLACVIK